MSLAAIPPLAAPGTAPLALQLAPLAAPLPAAVKTAASVDFSGLLMAGLHRVDVKVGEADAMVRRFSIDDSIPVHQVTMALEEARLSVELAMQVRTRLVEGYRELMNMQL